MWMLILVLAVTQNNRESRKHSRHVLPRVLTLTKTLYKVTEDLWRESYFINELRANREDTESLIFDPYFRYLRLE